MDKCLYTSSVNDLAYLPSVQPETRQAVDTIIHGRKTWKMTDDEAVWPPYIEAALIEALEMYRPKCNGKSKRLLRFPRRNVRISEHIFNKTGKERTAKQVSSRLQQLSNVKSPRIRKLLSRREFSPEREPVCTTDVSSPTTSSTSQSFSSTFSSLSIGSHSPAPSTAPSFESFVPPLTIVVKSDGSRKTSSINAPPQSQPLACIDLPQRSPLPTTAEPCAYVQVDDFPAETIVSQWDLSLRDLPHHHEVTPHHVSLVIPRALRPTNQMVTFVSPTVLSTSNHFSFFRVFLDGRHMHSEWTDLVPLSSAPGQTGDLTDSDGMQFGYETKLIPLYWFNLCQNADLRQCTIIQDIVETSSDTPSSPDSTSAPAAQGQSGVILSFVYDFAPVEQPGHHATTSSTAMSLTPPSPSGSTATSAYHDSQTSSPLSIIPVDSHYTSMDVHDDQSDYHSPSTDSPLHSDYDFSWNSHDIPATSLIDLDPRSMTGHNLVNEPHLHPCGAPSAEFQARYAIQDVDAPYAARPQPYRRSTYPTYYADNDWLDFSATYLQATEGDPSFVSTYTLS